MKKILLLIVLQFSVITNGFAKDIIQVSANQLISLQSAEKSESFIVLDVRSVNEYDTGHIKKALNIPHDQIASRLAELAEFKDSMVIVHCRSGRRAQIAEQILLANGFTNLRHLAGDFNGWKANKLPIEK